MDTCTSICTCTSREFIAAETEKYAPGCSIRAYMYSILPGLCNFLFLCPLYRFYSPSHPAPSSSASGSSSRAFGLSWSSAALDPDGPLPPRGPNVSRRHEEWPFSFGAPYLPRFTWYDFIGRRAIRGRLRGARIRAEFWAIRQLQSDASSFSRALSGRGRNIEINDRGASSCWEVVKVEGHDEFCKQCWTHQ